ncbi:hypothetical protein AXF42_Ash017040 [Apostasia shenzhenica]|uniref:Uncharacterized protein n=1 Tax=Apostasia shenzhenica TaxID=1088818 RepID=A0A2I0B7I3_9ASPA|nr:hypothetical protein AXF42_Ash017040 [Apostasia shenzhenica]
MSKLFFRLTRFFTSRTLVGVDKANNRYFARKEEVDGIGREASPDLKSFIQQFPDASYNENEGTEEAADSLIYDTKNERSSEPTGSGASYKPGTWQPPN